MATKEDILEQLVEEYLIHKGYFVRHNIKFVPRKDHPDFVSNQHSNHSDIDVVGFHPKLEGTDRVWVVNCKSWQSGFRAESELHNIIQDKKARGRKAWKSFRELTHSIWSQAFLDAIEKATGSRRFTYVIATAKVIGDPHVFERHPSFIEALQSNPIRILSFKNIIDEIYPALNTTLAASEVGRMLQMFKAAGIKI